MLRQLARAAVRAFTGAPPPAAPSEPPAPAAPASVRRLDIAREEGADCGEWADAHGQSINADLVADLAAAQARCQLLFTNNSYFRGVVLTYARHVVGRHGPRVQIHSEDEAFNEAVEKAYGVVMKGCDPAGRLSGPASLRCSVIHTMIGGSSLFVEKAVRRVDGPSFGWQTIHPRRLQTPSRYAGDPNVVLGIRYDAAGRPLEYYLDRQRGRHDVYHVPDGQNYTRVSADRVRHFFLDEEGEQVTGLPLMHSAARPALHVGEYDRDVMRTARAQAKTTFLLESNNPEFSLDPDPAPAYMTLAQGQGNQVPMGWTAKFPTATQPMAQYVPFRHERLAELGRPVGMPLILVLLSSAEGNFSQAQFDGSLYAEGIGDFQSELERQVVDWIVEGVITDTVLAGKATRPPEYTATYSWDRPPHANIEKVVKALRMMVEDGLIAPQDASAVMGYDWEEVVKRRKRNAEQLHEADLPPAPVNTGGVAAAGPDEDDQEGPGEGGAKSDDKKSGAKKSGAKAASTKHKEADHAGAR